MIGGTSQIDQQRASGSSATVLVGLENRFARSQPTTPVVAPGAGSASTGAART